MFTIPLVTLHHCLLLEKSPQQFSPNEPIIKALLRSDLKKIILLVDDDMTILEKWYTHYQANPAAHSPHATIPLVICVIAYLEQQGIEVLGVVSSMDPLHIIETLAPPPSTLSLMASQIESADPYERIKKRLSHTQYAKYRASIETRILSFINSKTPLPNFSTISGDLPELRDSGTPPPSSSQGFTFERRSNKSKMLEWLITSLGSPAEIRQRYQFIFFDNTGEDIRSFSTIAQKKSIKLHCLSTLLIAQGSQSFVSLTTSINPPLRSIQATLHSFPMASAINQSLCDPEFLLRRAAGYMEKAKTKELSYLIVLYYKWAFLLKPSFTLRDDIDAMPREHTELSNIGKIYLEMLAQSPDDFDFGKIQYSDTIDQAIVKADRQYLPIDEALFNKETFSGTDTESLIKMIVIMLVITNAYLAKYSETIPVSTREIDAISPLCQMLNANPYVSTLYVNMYQYFILAMQDPDCLTQEEREILGHLFLTYRCKEIVSCTAIHLLRLRHLDQEALTVISSMNPSHPWYRAEPSLMQAMADLFNSSID